MFSVSFSYNRNVSLESRVSRPLINGIFWQLYYIQTCCMLCCLVLPASLESRPIAPAPVPPTCCYLSAVGQPALHCSVMHYALHCTSLYLHCTLSHCTAFVIFYCTLAILHTARMVSALLEEMWWHEKTSTTARIRPSWGGLGASLVFNDCIGLIQVKEDGRTGFSKGWQGCAKGFPEA